MKILDDIYMVGSGRTGHSLSDENDCHVYLLDGGDEAALIDAGAGVDIEPLMRNIAALGIPAGHIRTIILTHGHADHSGGAPAIRARFGCRVAVGEAEADSLEHPERSMEALQVAISHGIYPRDYKMPPCPVDWRLRDGDSIQVGRHLLRVMMTPGHSPASMCLLFTLGDRQVLFSGDTIQFCPVAGQVGWISLLNDPDTDLDAYRESVRRLASLHVDVLLPGHRLWTLQNGQRVIDSLVRGFDTLAIPRSVI